MVDFEKAFDTVEHDALFEVLRRQGLPCHYICILQRLYNGQKASVQAGVRSRSFAIERGVKQGDPISALLFIAVMQSCFEEMQKKWRSLDARRTRCKYGIELSSDLEDRLTNLRFADDVILAAQNQNDIKKIRGWKLICLFSRLTKSSRTG